MEVCGFDFVEATRGGGVLDISFATRVRRSRRATITHTGHPNSARANALQYNIQYRSSVNKVVLVTSLVKIVILMGKRSLSIEGAMNQQVRELYIGEAVLPLDSKK